MTKTLTVKRKPIKCPNCGFRPVSTILYGMPFFDEKMEEDIKSKKIALGGCCITEYDPIWKCTNCNTDFWKEGQGVKINLEELLIKTKE